MVWFKIDDTFYDHPKLETLTLEAIGLWSLAGSYSARHLTDGEISARRVTMLGGTVDLADSLVAAGLWERTESGYLFADWHDYQPSRAEVEDKREKEREQARERMRRMRERKAANSDAEPVTGDAPVTPVTQASGDAPVTSLPTRPDPTRPTTGKSIDQRATPVDRLPHDFDLFWQAYPRKVGKQAALKAWRRAIKRTSPAAIVDACRAMANDPNLPTDKSFIPHPATWLNRDGWDDEPYPAQEVKPADKPTLIPPRFDPAALLPSDPIPMPDNVRQLLTRETS